MYLFDSYAVHVSRPGTIHHVSVYKDQRENLDIKVTGSELEENKNHVFDEFSSMVIF